METKRCAYCHKLQRVGSRICSSCGRSFGSRNGESGGSSRSLFSLPGASSHRVGHYSGLHPEDQPYQSQISIMPQRFVEEMQEKKALQQEPKHIVLPSVQNAPLEDMLFSSRNDDAPLLEDLPIYMQEDMLFSSRNDDAPLLEDLPLYMQKELRTRRSSPSRMMSTLLLSIGFCVLLATSIGVLFLMGNHRVTAQAHKSVLHTPAVATIMPTPSSLQISSNQAVFPASAPGVISSQTVTLKNAGAGQVVWQGNSAQSWLTTFPKSGTFADSEDVQITVNRGGIAPGNYTGQVTFALQGQENTPAVLNVTMSVAPLAAQLSISTTSLSYSTVQSQSPDSQVITIRNTGGQSLHWDATTQDSASWLGLSLYHGVIPAGVGQSLTVSVASQSLAVGTYTGLISFTGDAQAQVQVGLTVLAPGHLVITPSTLALSTQQTKQTLALQNSGGVSLDWTVTASTSDQGNWLSVTPASGTLAAGQSVTITVSANATSLAPGTYQGTLTFSAGGQTQQVAVSFAVVGTTPTAEPTPTVTPTPTPTSTPTSTRVRALAHSVVG